MHLKLYATLQNIQDGKFYKMILMTLQSGKTHHILRRAHGKNFAYTRVSIVEDTTESSLLSQLDAAKSNRNVIHLDISQFAPKNINLTLFKILYLGVMLDRQTGRFYYRRPNDLYAIEISSSLDKKLLKRLNICQNIPTIELKVNSDTFDLCKCKLVSTRNKISISLERDTKLQFVCKFLKVCNIYRIIII